MATGQLRRHTKRFAAASVGAAVFAVIVSGVHLHAAATGQAWKKLTIDVFAIGASVPFASCTFEDAIVTSNVLGSTTSAVSEQDAFD
jgi:hypothetical protein